MAPSLSDVLKVAQCSRSLFNNLERRGHLSAKIPESSPGVARPMAKLAAYEVAVQVALIDVGFSPVEAASRARVYFGLKPPTRPEWLFYEPASGGDIHSGPRGARKSVSDLAADLGSLGGKSGALVTDTAPKPVTRFVAVHIGEIIRRIDALFAAGNDDDHK